jgi:hypothetical protein
MLVYGTRQFGKVDEVPGHFHVATLCHHLWYLPIVPLESWVVLDGSAEFARGGGEWTAAGARLPSIRWTSFAVAWLRWILVCAAIFTTVPGLVGLFEVVLDGGSMRKAIDLAIAAAALGALALSYRLSRASRPRAEALCKVLGLSEDATSAVRRAVSR